MSTVGYAVADWNSGKKVYPNPEFVNFGSFGSRAFIGGIDGFLPKLGASFRNSGQFGDTREIISRRDTAKILVDRGFSQDEIARLWSNYKIDVQSKFDKGKFLAYADRRRIIDKARKEEEDRLYEKGKAEEEKQIINDLNLFPNNDDVIPTPQPDPVEVSSITVSKSNPNYLLYGGIGLAVLIGGFLIFKRK